MNIENINEAFENLKRIAAELEGKDELPIDRLDKLITEATDAYGICKNRLKHTKELLDKLKQIDATSS